MVIPNSFKFEPYASVCRLVGLSVGYVTSLFSTTCLRPGESAYDLVPNGRGSRQNFAEKDTRSHIKDLESINRIRET